MSIGQSFIHEYEHEMAGTRKVLERVPDDKLDWKAHPTMNTIGWVSSHLVEIASWTEGILKQSSWDLNPEGGEPYQSPTATSRAQLLTDFDTAVAAGKKAITETSDAEYLKEWSLLSGGQAIFTMPRAAVIRTFVLNHMIHHRAILTLYLRLNNIEVPGLYGPSGDGT